MLWLGLRASLDHAGESLVEYLIVDGTHDVSQVGSRRRRRWRWRVDALLAGLVVKVRHVLDVVDSGFAEEAHELRHEAQVACFTPQEEIYHRLVKLPGNREATPRVESSPVTDGVGYAQRRREASNIGLLRTRRVHAPPLVMAKQGVMHAVRCGLQVASRLAEVGE